MSETDDTVTGPAFVPAALAVNVQVMLSYLAALGLSAAEPPAARVNRPALTIEPDAPIVAIIGARALAGAKSALRRAAGAAGQDRLAELTAAIDLAQRNLGSARVLARRAPGRRKAIEDTVDRLARVVDRLWSGLVSH